MSEIQRFGATPTPAAAGPAPNAAAATRRTAPATAAPGPAATRAPAGTDTSTETRRRTTDRARSSQERIARLQQERAQIRDERLQLRAEQREEGRAGRQEDRPTAQRGERAARGSETGRRQAGANAAPAAQENAAAGTPAAGGAQDAAAPAQDPAAAPGPAGGAAPAPAPEATAPAEGTAPAPALAPGPAPASGAAPAPAADEAEVQGVLETNSTATGITITGTVRQTTGKLAENDVALEDSTVAEERGIAGVAIDDPGEGVTFRFEEVGNGLVRATRYEMRDGQEVAAGSQTLAITGAGDGLAGAPGALHFDDIGLELEIDDDYTAGDLQFVEISSGASTEAEVAAGALDEPATAERPEPTERQTAREQTLLQLDVRERQIEISLSDEESALLGLIERLAGVDDQPAPSVLTTGEMDREESLRALADSLVAQGSPAADRVLQLLG